MTATERDEARFWSKVALPNEQGCMLWLAYRLPSGYGMFWLNGKTHGAHRVSYELTCGPIPAALQIDHLCRVRHCVAPAHLEAVAGGENTRRGEGPTAMNAVKTHCPQGHPYAGDNLYVHSDGRRRCRACDCEASRRYRARKRSRSADTDHCLCGRRHGAHAGTTDGGRMKDNYAGLSPEGEALLGIGSQDMPVGTDEVREAMDDFRDAVLREAAAKIRTWGRAPGQGANTAFIFGEAADLIDPDKDN